MPTLIDVDGFAHQKTEVAQAGSGFAGIYTEAVLPAQITFDTTNKRTSDHVASMKITENGAGVYVGRGLAAGIRRLVFSMYIRTTAAPAAISRIWVVAGPTNFPRFYMTTGGNLAMYIGATTNVTTAGTYTDSAWHLIDADINCTAATFTIDWKIDGVAQTQVSLGGNTPADFSNPRLGDAATGNLTVWLQDYVLSSTGADYPIGPHVVLPLYPTGEGTDVLGSTNAIINQAAGNTNLYQTVDDWSGGTPSTTDYTTYTSTTTGDAASNYAEYTMSDPLAAYPNIWDVIGYIAGFASGTNANVATCRVVTGGGATIDNIGSGIDYSGSTTVLGYHKQLLARPGTTGWDGGVLAGTRVRWGFATDTNPLPRLSAVMLEYAAGAARGPSGLIVPQGIARAAVR